MGGEGEDNLRVWDQNIPTTINKINEQRGITVQHRKLYLTSCDNGKQEKNAKPYMWKTELLCCTVDIGTTL